MNKYLYGIDDCKSKPLCFDRYTVIHFGYGMLLTYILLVYYQFNEAYYIRILCIVFIIHTLYEIKDYLKTYIYPRKDLKSVSWDNNSLLNSVGDTIGFICGFLVMIFCSPKIQQYLTSIHMSILFIIIFWLILLFVAAWFHMALHRSTYGLMV